MVQAAVPVEAGDFDRKIRRALLLFYCFGLLVALLLIIDAAQLGFGRGELVVFAVGAAGCILGVRLIPWERLPRAAYLTFPLSGLVLVAIGMAGTGGSNSPFRSAIPLAVVFACLIVDWRYALSVAFAGALVATSPSLYHPMAQPLAVVLASVASYAILIYMVNIIAERVRLHERAAAAEAVVREQTEQRATGLITLQRVSAIVGSYLSMDDAIAAIVDELDRAFGHQLISVYLIEGDTLVMQAQIGYENPYTVIQLGVGICGRVGQSGQTEFVPDVSQDSDYRPALANVVSELCVPLHDGGRVAGILNIESRTRLTALDCELLELFGAQVSVVLRNARQAGELRVLAEHDPLTGLSNHRTVMEELDCLLAPPAARCAVLMVDLNEFKACNDTYGHLAGDAVLQHVSAILRESCRQDDIAGRVGGDEFMLVLPLAGALLAQTIGQRIRRAVHDRPYCAPDGRQIQLSVSIGAAIAPDDARTRQQLIAAADAAMYQVKQAGT
ncbi:MAG: sensor domain-containing diguanylate cyclase [Chloroflexota bacterium]|nr:sensor domain-containing diguanylate cyclase [Chloroflexota bacterium]